jgi:hypothetical protein
VLGAKCVCSHRVLRRFARAASFTILHMVPLGLSFLRKLQLPCFCLVVLIIVVFSFVLVPPLLCPGGGGVVMSQLGRPWRRGGGFYSAGL